jgi:uncharacterized membrane protein YphA (DoxX/SURF4 family)
MKKTISNINVASWLLRIGLAIVFLYAAVSSLQHPVEWIGFLPKFLTKAVDGTILIKFFAVYELVLATWLLSGKFLRYCALLCTPTLGGIVVMNPSQLITTFRDIGLTFMALALVFVEK